MAHTLHFAAAALTDPDAQSAIADFVDYTEYFPSDLFRSLTLIRQLDEAAENEIANIHRLTKILGSLPTLPARERPNPADVRREISVSLEHQHKCRASSYAESLRLRNSTETLRDRIHMIATKLEAQPKPPSREPTPTPQANRVRRGDYDRLPRIKVVPDGQNRNSHRSSGAFSRRRIIVPGEVLPPRDPNSPSPSAVSDSEPDRAPTPMIRHPAAARLEKEKVQKEKTPKPALPEKLKILKTPKIRGPGQMGTNAHSSVAGISVSNAIAQLAPPPENPQPGSRHAPWRELTEWELNTIRKRMKKNADWMPSDIMVRRELKVKGRGLENYERAKRAAEEKGEEIVDEHPDPFTRPVVARMSASEPRFAVQDEQSLVNRGMKLNEAKKLKRQQMLLEKAQEAALNENAAAPPAADVQIAANAPKDPKSEATEQTQPKKEKKKRKRADDMTDKQKDVKPPAVPTSTGEGRMIKKIKIQPPVPAAADDGDVSMTDELAADMPPPTPGHSRHAQKDSIHQNHANSKSHKRGKRSSAVTAGTANPIVEAVPDSKSTPVDFNTSTSSARPRSRGTTNMKPKIPKTKAASAEPEVDKRRISVRRTSAGGAAESTFKFSIARSMHQSTETAASRRGRRPAPGILASHADEPGPKVSIAKRKTATSRMTSDRQIKAEVEGELGLASEEEEAKDGPWCLCGHSSYGQMVACENERTCPIQWFHVGCVGLQDVARKMRTLQWYCPECRDECGVGADGIKGR